MMKLIIVKQGSGKYLFCVPEDIEVKACENVLVNTKYGEDMGITMCDSFECEEEAAKKLMQSFCTDEKNMKYVVGRIRYDRF